MNDWMCLSRERTMQQLSRAALDRVGTGSYEDTAGLRVQRTENGPAEK